ncbi:MAG: hypothetical protein ABI824_20130 [Acidobacteriota bacterium]
MNGQWMGAYKGIAHDGTLLVNIDERRSHFEGTAYFRPNNKEVPGSRVNFRTLDKEKEFKFLTSNFAAIDPLTGNDTSFDAVKQFYPKGFSVASEIEVAGRWDKSHLEFGWQSEGGLSGSADLPQSRASEPSELQAQSLGWKEFKAYVADLAGTRHLFRGQSEPQRLRTKFHRSGRADLRRFTSDDIQVLHRRLSVRTKHIFDLNKGEENGAFFNLVGCP